MDPHEIAVKAIIYIDSLADTDDQVVAAVALVNEAYEAYMAEKEPFPTMH